VTLDGGPNTSLEPTTDAVSVGTLMNSSDIFDALLPRLTRLWLGLIR
jgi:hypothetical protein